MNCPNCGAPIGPNEKFCTNCGTAIPSQSGSAQPQYGAGQSQQAYQQAYAQPTRPAQDPPYSPYSPSGSSQIPPEYKPLSPWAYFGYSILFAIPIVGFILLIVYSFNNENLNRRNYARSFWCALLIAVILTVVLSLLGVVSSAMLRDALRTLR